MRRAAKLAVIAILAAPVLPAAADPTADHWEAIGNGIRGANGTVIAVVADDSGNFYVGGGFTVIGDVLANGVAKWDGQHWSALGAGMDHEVRCLAVDGDRLYAGGLFTTAGGVEASKVAVWDGQDWAPLGDGLTGREVSTIAAHQGRVYAGGLVESSGETPLNNVAMWDGTTWSPLGSGTDGRVSSFAFAGTDVYVGGSFETAGGVPAQQVAKWNGTEWSSVGFPGPRLNNREVLALCFMNGDLYAGGNLPNLTSPLGGNQLARWDGTTWSLLSLLGEGPSGLGWNVRALAAAESTLYVGGEIGIRKWDGHALLPAFESESAPSFVRGLAAHGDQLMVVGGSPNSGEADWGRNIALWNGTAWSELGFDPAEHDIAERELGYRSASVKVAGSDIFLATGSSGGGVLHWNGARWARLGGSKVNLNRGVYPMRYLEVAGPDLYVSMSADSLTGVAGDYIARWDGTSWSPLGAGINDQAWVLEADGQDLYVGGEFTEAGGNPAGHIARWDGTEWHALGAGMDGRVTTLLVEENEVVAGGAFATAGGSAANHVATWDGSQWSPLGDGLPHPVADVVRWGSELYAAVHPAPGSPDPFAVHRWDGAAWSLVADSASGAIGWVPTLGVVDGALAIVSFRVDDTGASTDLILSLWDGTSWNESRIGRSENKTPVRGNGWSYPNTPPVDFANGSLYVTNNSQLTGSALFLSPSLDPMEREGKVSPGVARLVLGKLPPVSVADGRATIHFREPHVIPGRRHAIQRSIDLQDWDVIGSRSAGPIGGIDFTDPDAPEGSAFYRAVPVE